MSNKKSNQINTRVLTFGLSKEIDKKLLSSVSGGAKALATCRVTGSGGSHGGSIDTVCDF